MELRHTTALSAFHSRPIPKQTCHRQRQQHRQSVQMKSSTTTNNTSLLLRSVLCLLLASSLKLKILSVSAFSSPSGPPLLSSSRYHCSVTTIPRGGGGSRGGTVLSLSPAIHSILAGSIAGSIGVGVAFPLDTLKTKAQVIGQQLQLQQRIDTTTTTDTHMAPMNMFQITKLIYQTDGLSGFFGGVKGMMAGQAMIKAAAFSANTFMFNTLMDSHDWGTNTVPPLIIAAGFAGFVTSFLVAPIERIKVMMQASDTYTNEWECGAAVLAKEGWIGLLGRGLGPTLAREVPSYGIYFVVYGILSQSLGWIGPAAPLINGALAGMACWIPVYPIDVVKTMVQNTEGGTKVSSWAVATQIYKTGGIGAFFDGLTPKMLRAALNHSVTFYLYDIIMKSWTA